MAFEKFHWTSPTGVEIVLPHLSKIKGGLLRKYRKLDEMDMVFSIIEDVVDDETLVKLDDLDQEELQNFMKDWQAGASVGESSGSST